MIIYIKTETRLRKQGSADKFTSYSKASKCVIVPIGTSVVIYAPSARTHARWLAAEPRCAGLVALPMGHIRVQ